MLPKVSGIDVCRQLRKRRQVPIIMVTAKGAEIDTVVGLEVGADDYVTKPYRLRELVARMRAVLRRAPATTRRRRARRGARGRRCGARPRAPRGRRSGATQVQLPLKEFELLELLLDNAGRVLTRETLIDRVWGSDYVGDTKTLDVHIKRLRSKVEERLPAPRAASSPSGAWATSTTSRRDRTSRMGRAFATRSEQARPPASPLFGHWRSPSRKTQTDIVVMEVVTADGIIVCLRHGLDAGEEATTLFLGGALGGLSGPAHGLYHTLGARLGGVRVHYRKPGRLEDCLFDVLLVHNLLTRRVSSGSPWATRSEVQSPWAWEPFSAPRRRAWSLSTQVPGTEAVDRLRVTSCLVHGDSDGVLPDLCSRNVDQPATSARGRDPRRAPRRQGPPALRPGRGRASTSSSRPLPGRTGGGERLTMRPPARTMGRRLRRSHAPSMGEPIKTETGFVSCHRSRASVHPRPHGCRRHPRRRCACGVAVLRHHA